MGFWENGILEKWDFGKWEFGKIGFSENEILGNFYFFNMEFWENYVYISRQGHWWAEGPKASRQA